MGNHKEKVAEEYSKFKEPGPDAAGYIKSQVLFGNMTAKVGQLALTLLSLAPSSGGVERVFSTMGFIHDDYRNKLSNEKVAKLAFCMRALRK